MSSTTDDDWLAGRAHSGTSAGGIDGAAGGAVAPGTPSWARLSIAGCLLPAGPSANAASSRVVIAVSTRCTSATAVPANLQPGSSAQIHHWVPEENTAAPLGAV